jgi:hypothetical protein
MRKSKSQGKDKKKTAQLVLRVEKAERDDFVALCDRLDTTAAREIRRFMRDWVASHAQTPPIVAGEPDVASLTPEFAPELAVAPITEPDAAPVPEAAPEEPVATAEPVRRKKRAVT